MKPPSIRQMAERLASSACPDARALALAIVAAAPALRIARHETSRAFMAANESGNSAASPLNIALVALDSVTGDDEMRS
jgi:hypothetical protein